MTWLKWILVALLAAAALWGIASVLGTARWRAATETLEARLDAAHAPLAPARYDAARELPGLPAPVQRFFRAALTDGQPMVAAVTIEHRGEFNLAAEGADRWVPFASRQQVSARRPGFVWEARMAMMGVPVFVHDAYVAGEGLLHAALLGLVPLVELRGASAEPEGVAAGEFMRWFAEAAWYPTALLPSQGVRWSAVDAQSALATASDGAVSATLLFRFDAAKGLIDSVRAEARGRTVGKAVAMTPWEGRWSGYAEREGMRVPMKGEVAWLIAAERRAYWRGEVGSLVYEFAR